MKQNCGKCKDCGEKLERLDIFSLSRRWQQLAKSTLFRILKKIHKTSIIKPFPTEKNKKNRVEFCLSKVLPEKKFIDFKHYIHIDEK